VTAASAHTPEARQTHSERPHITRAATKTRDDSRQIESTSPTARNAASVSLCGTTSLNLRPSCVVVHFTLERPSQALKASRNDGMRECWCKMPVPPNGARLH
jgi:hypothetical protein